MLKKVDGVESFQTIEGTARSPAPTSRTSKHLRAPQARDERHDESLQVFGIMRRMAAELAAIPEAVAFPFNIPTISGFGASAGFNFLLQDRSGC